MALTGALMLGLAFFVLSWGYGAASTLILQSSSDNWFRYHDVAYVREGTEGQLWFESDAEWNVELDFVSWHDELRCDSTGDGAFTHYSGQRTTAEEYDTLGRNRAEWPYLGAYPPATECQLKSVIRATRDDVGVVQTFLGEPFTTGEAR